MMRMWTKLTLAVHSEENNEKHRQVWVTESYDAVVDKCYPITPPSSNLQAREQQQFTLHTGLRFCIPTHAILTFEETNEEPT